MDHTRGGRREVDDTAGDQPKIEQFSEVVRGLTEQLAKLKSHSDTLEPYEIAELRELLPQLKDILENRRRQQWLWKRIGAFLLGGPALLALWQAGTKLIEWIRSQ